MKQLLSLSPRIYCGVMSNVQTPQQVRGDKFQARRWFVIFPLILTFLLTLTACGFHLQGEMALAPPLHRLYLQSPDPYGYLSRTLQNYLKMSHVQLVSTPEEATTILNISQDETSQQFLNVSGTQQTRQYNLHVTVTFEVTDTKGRTIFGPQTLTETRTITVQSNQILGSSNEANLFYQQMRRVIAYSIMNRLASNSATHAILAAFPPTKKNS